MFSGTHFHYALHLSVIPKQKHNVLQHIPRPTFSMLVLSNCSLRSAMTALWDWRVWSDTIILLSRSRLASSRDVTSFSSRHTSSSRCCCCDCHCKQTSNLQFVSEKRKNFPMWRAHQCAGFFTPWFCLFVLSLEVYHFTCYLLLLCRPFFNNDCKR